MDTARTGRAVRPDDIGTGGTQPVHGSLRHHPTERPHLASEAHRRHERKRANRTGNADCELELGEIGKRFEHEEVYAGVGQGSDLLDVGSSRIFGGERSERAEPGARRTHRTRHEHRSTGLIGSLPGEAGTGGVDVDGSVRHPPTVEVNGGGREGVRLHDVGTGRHERSVDVEDDVRAGKVQTLEGLLESDACSVDHGPHRAVGDKWVFEESVEEVHWYVHLRVGANTESMTDQAIRESLAVEVGDRVSGDSTVGDGSDESLGERRNRCIHLGQAHDEPGVGWNVLATSARARYQFSGAFRGEAVIRRAAEHGTDAKRSMALILDGSIERVGADHTDHHRDGGGEHRLVPVRGLRRTTTGSVGLGNHVGTETE